MGCSESKSEDLPLASRCRERRELIRAAANHRYALASAHVSYFRSLKYVGDALRKFVDEVLITTSPSSSPSLILPPNFKTKHDSDEDEEESHLHISGSSSEEDEEVRTSPIPHYYNYPGGGFNGYGSYGGQGFGEGMGNDPFMYPYQYVDPLYYTNNSNAYYMNKSAPATRTEPAISPFGDFFNLFDGGYYSSGGGYGYVLNSSGPDSSEVREREGIPELEEETEDEVYIVRFKGKKMKDNGKMNYEASSFHSKAAPPVHRNRGGSSRSLPPHKSESSMESEKPSKPPLYSKGKSWIEQFPNGEMAGSVSFTDEKGSPVDEGHVKKSFEVEGRSKQDIADSSKSSSVSLLSPHGTRNLREVVAEIRNEFEIASSYGKEVAMMLEVGKMPYHPSFLRVLISRILYLISPSLSLRDPPSLQSSKVASRTMKLAKSYFEDVGKDVKAKVCNISLILDKLYAWEQKLYKEVKQGAESSKIYAAQASVMRLLTTLDVSIKAIDAISRRIHKLRDEELQPQVAALIQGLIRMWKAMLKCHQKQFQAIMESKTRKLKAKTGLQTESNSRATIELEKELHTLDGTVPYSPGQLGAPPIFVLCNDWHQAMESIPEARVAKAINTFATSFRQLWEKQEYLSKDYEKQLRTQCMGRVKLEDEENTVSRSNSGISPLDDLKVDLDSTRQRLIEERMKHKDAMNYEIRGLVPIFKALENITSEALKVHEDVRLQHLETRL
ncbi:hypothetical protein ACJIZ3_002923 [Penstemon smallii]|uniref:Uncharacterized protein n=1 Tax=Penstemon smallii TaxID=265156 RepID=A0ABD3U948_9LAMI